MHRGAVHKKTFVVTLFDTCPLEDAIPAPTQRLVFDPSSHTDWIDSELAILIYWFQILICEFPAAAKITENNYLFISKSLDGFKVNCL